MKNTIMIMTLLLISINTCLGLSLVVNKSNPTTSITKAELKQYFYAKKQVWDNGEAVTLVVNSENKILLKEFTKILGTDSSKFQNDWIKITLSGQAAPPESASSDKEVISLVNDTKGAIGFVKSASGPVKTIKIK